VTEYVNVRDLPAPIQSALKAVEYGRPDIRVEASEKVQLGDMGAGNGYQSFACLVNLSTGEHRVIRGSWGGINMFDRTNPVDNDMGQYALPGDGVVITGQRGGGRPVYAVLNIPASMVSRMLPSGQKVELTDQERDVLAVFVGMKSSYRSEWLQRHAIPESVVTGLVSRGLLKENRAGARQVTTDGRNAVGNHRVYY
jgi:hypothetical protein